MFIDNIYILLLLVFIHFFLELVCKKMRFFLLLKTKKMNSKK